VSNFKKKPKEERKIVSQPPTGSHERVGVQQSSRGQNRAALEKKQAEVAGKYQARSAPAVLGWLLLAPASEFPQGPS